MPYNFDPRKIDKELTLTEDEGFNCLRVVLPFVVWEATLTVYRQADGEEL